MDGGPQMPVVRFLVPSAVSGSHQGSLLCASAGEGRLPAAGGQSTAPYKATGHGPEPTPPSRAHKTSQPTQGRLKQRAENWPPLTL